MPTTNPIELAAEIVMAFVSNNSVPRSELTALFETVHTAVRRLVDGERAPPAVEMPTPAVSVRKSVTPDYLICLDDGKRFKSLRRHLNVLGMTPEQVEAQFGFFVRALDYGAPPHGGMALGVDRIAMIPAMNDPLPSTPERLLAARDRGV